MEQPGGRARRLVAVLIVAAAALGIVAGQLTCPGSFVSGVLKG